MDDRSVANMIGEWLEDDIGVAKVYPYPIANADGPLPDAVVHVTEKRVTDDVPEDLAGFHLEQIWLRIYAVAVSIMVEVSAQTEAAADDADETARGFGAAIEASVWDDPTLAGRLDGGAVSPRLRVDYSTPFADRTDGTRGRFVIVEMTVAEPIDAPG